MLGPRKSLWFLEALPFLRLVGMSYSCRHDARHHRYGLDETHDRGPMLSVLLVLVGSSSTALLPASRCVPIGILTLASLSHGSVVALGSSLGCCLCCLGVV